MMGAAMKMAVLCCWALAGDLAQPGGSPAPPPAGEANEPVAPIIARQATPEQLGNQEIPSPMLLEVSLGPSGKRKSVRDVDAQHAWIAAETDRFVCRKARVRLIQVWREERRGKVRLRVIPILRTEERRQDVDVTVAVVSDGKEVRRKVFSSLTIGADDSTANKLGILLTFAPAFGSKSKGPVSEFQFTDQEFAAMFGAGRAPSVRVVLEIRE